MPKDLADLIRHRRKELKLDTRDLEAISGVPWQAIAKMGDPECDVMQHAASVLSVIEALGRELRVPRKFKCATLRVTRKQL